MVLSAPGEGTPKAPYRLVATDLDGTLLGSDGEVSPRTRASLDALDELGVTVVFVTGRPIRWIEDLREHVGHHGLAVVSNGAAVLDVHSEAVLRHHPIDRETGLKVSERLRRELPGTTFAMEGLDGFAMEPGYLPVLADREDPDAVLGPLEDVYADDVVKLLALHDRHSPEDYWELVDASVGGLVTTTWASSGRPMVEMSALGVTKASALRQICADRGIPSAEVVAFGDMPNDGDMLAWAGRSYAMANAHPSLFERAVNVAPRNEEDGVAQVLEKLFGL